MTGKALAIPVMISVKKQEPLTSAEATFVLRIRQTQTTRTKRLLEKVFMILLLQVLLYFQQIQIDSNGFPLVDSFSTANMTRKNMCACLFYILAQFLVKHFLEKPRHVIFYDWSGIIWGRLYKKVVKVNCS